VTGFKECCISHCSEGTDGDMVWNVRSECEEEEGTDCEMETATLIGKGRKNLT
jgi:hypothetical protein